MLAIGMDKEIAFFAGEMNRPYILGAILYSVFDMFKAYVSAHKEFTPVFQIHMFSMIIHPFWAWLFIIHWRLGLVGAALARAAEEATNLTLMLVFYFTLDSVKKTRNKPTMTGFNLTNIWK